MCCLSGEGGGDGTCVMGQMKLVWLWVTIMSSSTPSGPSASRSACRPSGGEGKKWLSLPSLTRRDQGGTEGRRLTAAEHAGVSPWAGRLAAQSPFCSGKNRAGQGALCPLWVRTPGLPVSGRSPLQSHGELRCEECPWGPGAWLWCQEGLLVPFTSSWQAVG